MFRIGLDLRVLSVEEWDGLEPLVLRNGKDLRVFSFEE